MTTELLTQKCNYWLERLQMAEWRGRVKIEVKGSDHMGDAVGYVRWSSEECTATIEILEGRGEATLLHEIGHLLWQGHKAYKRYNAMEERAINRMVFGFLGEEDNDV